MRHPLGRTCRPTDRTVFSLHKVLWCKNWGLLRKEPHPGGSKGFPSPQSFLSSDDNDEACQARDSDVPSCSIPQDEAQEDQDRNRAMQTLRSSLQSSLRSSPPPVQLTFPEKGDLVPRAQLLAESAYRVTRAGRYPETSRRLQHHRGDMNRDAEKASDIQGTFVEMKHNSRAEIRE